MEPQTTRLSDILTRRGLTLGVAESCTGGLLGGRVTAAAGASAYFRGGVIAYDNSVKRELLGVSAEDLEKYGAVSDPVVRAMAAGAAKLLDCGCAVSVSGIAGPDGGSNEKPVGLVFTGVFYNGQTQARSFVFSGSREEIREQSVAAAIDFLIEIVTQGQSPRSRPPPDKGFQPLVGIRDEIQQGGMPPC